jgi:hypothetical protein
MQNRPLPKTVAEALAALLEMGLWNGFLRNANENEFNAWLISLGHRYAPDAVFLRESWRLYEHAYGPAWYWRLFGWRNIDASQKQSPRNGFLIVGCVIILCLVVLIGKF